MTTTDKPSNLQGQPVFAVQQQALMEAIDGNGIDSAGDLEVTDGSGDNESDIASGTAYYDGSSGSIGSAKTKTHSDGDSSNDRWDLLAFDVSADSVVLREGTAAADPTPPDLQSNEVLLALVYIESEQTDFAGSDIINWRALAGAGFGHDHSGQLSTVPNGGLTNSKITRTAGTGLKYSSGSAGTALGGSATIAVDESASLTWTSQQTFNAGIELDSGQSVTFSDDDGAQTLADMAVTSSPTAGTEESLALAVDATTIAKAYAEADGSGGVQNAALRLAQALDTNGNDIEDSGTTIWDTSNAYVPRAQQDQDLVTASVSSNTTTSDEEIIFVDSSAGTYTITLASADTVDGNQIAIVDDGGNANSNNITIDAESSESIEGSSSVTISDDYGSYLLESNGSNWRVIAQTPSSGSASPGGSDTQIQYNNSGSFGGISSFTFGGTNLTGVPGIDDTLALVDQAADPAANGEVQLNGTDVKVYSGGSVRNLTNVNSVTALSDLADASVSTPSAGETLLYHATNSQFENSTITAGSGLTSTTGDASFTLNVGSGTAITVNSGDVQVTSGGITTTEIDLSISPAWTGTHDYTGGGLQLPSGTSKSPTTEAQIAWDSDDDKIKVGDGSTTVTAVNESRTLTGGNAIDSLGDLSTDRTIAVSSGGIQTDELDLSITPTWTGKHQFDAGVDTRGDIEDDTTTIWDSSGGHVEQSALENDTITRTAGTGLTYSSGSAGTALGGSATIDIASDGVTGTEINLSDIAGENITVDTNNDELDASGGGTSWSTVTKTSNYTASNYENVLVDASSSAVTVTLPTAATDLMVTVKATDATNTVTIATPNSETIDGDSNRTIDQTNVALTLTSDGSNYFIV